MATATDFGLTFAGSAQAVSDRFEVINPATGEPFALCPAATEAQLDEAVAAAAAAQSAWSRRPLAERRALLANYADAIDSRADELAVLLTKEQGKPLADAKFEVQRTRYYLEQLAGIDLPDEVLLEDDQRRVIMTHGPLGVVGAITPWNFPVVIAVAKIVSALVTGNAIVLKPSPYTPLTSLRLGEIAQDIFPAGLVNVLSGTDQLGAALSRHPGVSKISFTGSIATGKRIMAAGADTLKRLTLELGGNDPALVLRDADVDKAVKGLAFAIFVNAGQVCTAAKRAYVHADLYEEVCEGIAAATREIVVGDGLDPKTQMGPVQNRAQRDRVLELMEDAVRRGGRAIAGGHALGDQGYFIAPTLFTGVESTARIVTEEQFGPVAPILSFEDEADAIKHANDTPFGLAASVWSEDLTHAEAVARQLEAGTIWINQHGGLDARIPFGGAKESGVGYEYAALGLAGYSQRKVIFSPKA